MDNLLALRAVERKLQEQVNLDTICDSSSRVAKEQRLECLVVASQTIPNLPTDLTVGSRELFCLGHVSRPTVGAYMRLAQSATPLNMFFKGVALKQEKADLFHVEQEDTERPMSPAARTSMVFWS